MTDFVYVSGGAGYVADGGTSTFDSTGATFLIVAFGSFSAPSAVEVSDNFGNSFTLDTTIDQEAATAILHCANPVVGANHRVTSSISGVAGVGAICFSGGTSTKESGSTNSTAAPGASSITTGALTPGGAHRLLIVSCGITKDGGDVLSSSYSINSGVTLQEKTSVVEFLPPLGSPRDGMMLGYLINPAASSINPQCAWTGTRPCAASMAIYGAPPQAGTWKSNNGLLVPATSTLKVHNGTALASIKFHNGLIP